MMRKIWSRKIFIIILGIIAVSALLFFIFQIEKPSVVHSGIKDNINIRGWMWSASDRGYPGGIGWIALNCYNDYNDDGLPENCCPGGRDSCPHQPAKDDYGLQLTKENKISGYAWSPNVGWLCFGETCAATAPDGLPAWACLGNKFNERNACLGDCGEDFNHPSQTACTNQISDENLQGHWKMNEGRGTTTADSSGNNNNGILYSGEESCAEPPTPGCPRWFAGKFNKALEFDGVDDYVFLKEIKSLSRVEDFTIEAWVKLDSEASSTEWHTIYGREKGVRLLIKPDSDYKDTQYLFGLSIDGKDYNCEGEISRADARKWTHWALVREEKKKEEGELKVYWNGQLVKTCESGDGSADINGWIGITSPNYQFPFKGIIDNVAVWTRAKSVEGIWDDAKAEISGWAKVMWSNQPDDGWIRLKAKPESFEKNIVYGLSLEKFSTHTELQGFAWSHFYNPQNPQISNIGLGWLAPCYGCLPRNPGEIKEFSVSSLTANCRSLALKWRDVSCAQRYKIYRYYREEVRLIDEIVASDFCSNGECSYEDQGLLPNRVYRYQIQAWNFNGDGPISTMERGTTVPCPPQLPSPPCQAIDSSKCGEIKITWKKVVDTDPGITIKYNVYRSLQPNGCPLGKCRKLTPSPIDCQETICGETTLSCFYIDKQILANVDYYYWVSAVSEAGESALTSMGRGKSVCLPTTQWQEQ